MSAIKTDVQSFDVHADAAMVRVISDDDLFIKFKRGEALRGDSGTMHVAMALGIDESDVARIDLKNCAGFSMLQKLEWIRRVVQIAIDGCPT